jgi:dihydrofolate synthase / folylpolyglutamate synthase
MLYSSLLQRLYQRTTSRGMKLGMDNIHRLTQAFQCPQTSFKTVHIAGTNGKGSVSTKIAKTLELQGLRVGLYTSPHISSFRERIKINGEMITEEKVIAYLQDIFEITDHLQIPATFFEMTTLLAFRHFATERVDWAVLETGLGGRLDATNIVDPIASVITSISHDHTEILGNTLDEITREKAGIIKAKKPVIIGPRVPYNIVKPIADNVGAPCIQVQGIFDDFEQENRAIAKCALEYLHYPLYDIMQGLEAIPACRMEIISVPQHPRPIILDVAHNPDGLEKLFQSIRRKFPHETYRVICGLSKSKDIN